MNETAVSLHETSAAGLVDFGVPPYLPPVTAPWHEPVVVHDGLAWCSGQIASNVEGVLVARGRLGEDVDVDAGVRCARQCAANALGQLSRALGGLQAIDRLIRVTVYVAAAPAFSEHAAVGHGASTLFEAVLGARGSHCRSAVGVSSLPLGTPVEVEVVAAVQPAHAAP